MTREETNARRMQKYYDDKAKGVLAKKTISKPKSKSQEAKAEALNKKLMELYGKLPPDIPDDHYDDHERDDKDDEDEGGAGSTAGMTSSGWTVVNPEAQRRRGSSSILPAKKCQGADELMTSCIST